MLQACKEAGRRSDWFQENIDGCDEEKVVCCERQRRRRRRMVKDSSRLYTGDDQHHPLIQPALAASTPSTGLRAFTSFSAVSQIIANQHVNIQAKDRMRCRQRYDLKIVADRSIYPPSRHTASDELQTPSSHYHHLILTFVLAFCRAKLEEENETRRPRLNKTPSPYASQVSHGITASRLSCHDYLSP